MKWKGTVLCSSVFVFLFSIWVRWHAEAANVILWSQEPHFEWYDVVDPIYFNPSGYGFLDYNMP